MGTIYCLLDDTKKVPGAKTYLNKNEQEFKTLNAQGWGVYFSVNEFAGDRKTENCTRLRYVYGDLDIGKAGDGQTREERQAKKQALLKEIIAKCEPTMVIDTSNGLQPLWELVAGEPTTENKERYVRVLKGLVAWSKQHGCKADNVYDISRILRVPGYDHMKEEPYACEVIYQSVKKYNLAGLEIIFPFKELKVLPGIPEHTGDNPVFREIERLDFKEMVMRAFSSIGRPVTFDVSGHLIDPIGKTTGTFLGRQGNRDYLASSSHEPFKGNRITAIAEILNITYSDAYKWICREYGLNYQKLVQQETKTISAIKKDGVEFVTMSDIVEMGYKELVATNANQVISFGYSWLDDKLVGIFPSELVVLGGESGTGKTALATNIIYKASKKVKCGIYALEDRLPDYGIKALFYEVNKIKKNYEAGSKGYWWNDFRLNEIRDIQYPRYLEEARASLKNDNIFFAKVNEMMSIDLLETLVYDQISKGIKLFLVDHLHYFDMSSKEDSKADYVEKIMVRLKTLLNKTGASMILIVHYKKLEGKKPGIDSFKDSVAIPQNANYVINLWRERSSDKANATEQLGDRIIEKKFITHFMIPKVRNPNGEGTYKAIWNADKGDYEDEKYAWKFGTSTKSEDIIIGELLNNIKF